jgi:hypothetical protein
MRYDSGDRNQASMKRRIFNLMVGLSLLICAATVALWLRSYFVQPPPAVYSDRWLYDEGYAAIYKGEFTFVYSDTQPKSAKWFQLVRLNTTPLRVYQFMVSSEWNAGVVVWYTSVELRLWLVVVVALLVPITAMARFLRDRSRPVEGKCRNCGFDLRATPDRCPECGTAIIAPSEARSA